MPQSLGPTFVLAYHQTLTLNKLPIQPLIFNRQLSINPPAQHRYRLAPTIQTHLVRRLIHSIHKPRHNHHPRLHQHRHHFLYHSSAILRHLPAPHNRQPHFILRQQLQVTLVPQPLKLRRPNPRQTPCQPLHHPCFHYFNISNHKNHFLSCKTKLSKPNPSFL